MILFASIKPDIAEALYVSGSGLNRTEICQRFNSEIANFEVVSIALDEMENDGLIKKNTACPENRYAWQLTDNGRAMYINSPESIPVDLARHNQDDLGTRLRTAAIRQGIGNLEKTMDSSKTERELIEISTEIGGMSESNCHYTAGMARRIDQTGRAITELTVGELLTLHRQYNQEFNEMYR